jgi:succinyl-diaminopimelate desuccinylase
MLRDESGGALGPQGIEDLWKAGRELQEGMVAFARRLIQTPSLPGEEGNVASLVASEMEMLGYDEVRVDEAGNVIGHVRPNAAAGGERRSIMFNTHMDHVDVGDPARWPFPPYAATVHEGEIWGRGASDLKGSLAAQVYAGALLKRSGAPLRNDVYVVGVVQEEIGGLGSALLARHLKTDYAVIGEPSGNVLALGHRGRVEVLVTITGKSVHASVPQSGINPLYSMSRLLLALQAMRFEIDPSGPALGPTTVAPTLISTDQTSVNVVPGECRLLLDIRNTPMDRPGVLVDRVRALLVEALEDGAEGTVEIVPKTMVSYTGVTHTVDNAAPAFSVAPGSPLLAGAEAALRAALGREPQTKIWPFATDAGHLLVEGIEVIGFGPGREDVIHTVNERISIDEMVEAMVANAAIALGVG